MANLCSEYSLQTLPGPKLVANFDACQPRKEASKKIIYYDVSDPAVVAEVDRRELEYDPDRAAKPVLPGVRTGLEFGKALTRDQSLFGQRQFGQNASLMKVNTYLSLNTEFFFKTIINKDPLSYEKPYC